MAFKNTAVSKMIREDLEKTQGGYEIVQASLLERMGVKKVSLSELHVNPNDEFSDPEIGPNDSIVNNYSSIARRDASLGLPVYEEPIVVCKIRSGGFMMLNGHHRWAGAILAHIAKVRIQITNPKNI